MRKLPLYLWVLLMPTTLYAQFKNNIWLLGYENVSPQPFGGTRIEFNDTNRYIQYEQHNISFAGTYSGLINEDYGWFVYTNGYAICNKYHDTLTNGGGLSPGGNTSWVNAGNPIPNQAVLLPAQTSGNLIYLFHSNYDISSNNDVFSLNFYFSLVDPSSGLNGTVYLKNQLIISDSLNAGPINVCRHANGRDWWILIKKFRSKKFYTILTSPSGIETVYLQELMNDTIASAGLGSFSKDGRYFATCDNRNGFNLYEFNRCTGQLSNLIRKDPFWNSAGGLTFSPNSRFVYISNFDSILQYDLQAANILGSEITVGISDSFLDSLFTQSMKFSYMLTASYGKIYITYFSTNRYLAVINNPDNAGTACNFVGHQVLLPTFNLDTTPTPVNLNLFQEPGSPCDTLGVGLNENADIGFKLKVNPNPNNGRFYIEYKAQTKNGLLYLYDINGKEILSEYISPYTTQHEVDVSNKIMPGMYALALVFDEKREVKTVVIK